MRRCKHQGRLFMSELSRKGDLAIHVHEWPFIRLEVRAKVIKARMNTKVLYLKFIDRYHGDVYKNIIKADV